MFFKALWREKVLNRRRADGVQGLEQHHEQGCAEPHQAQLVCAKGLGDVLELGRARGGHEEVSDESQDQKPEDGSPAGVGSRKPQSAKNPESMSARHEVESSAAEHYKEEY